MGELPSHSSPTPNADLLTDEILTFVNQNVAAYLVESVGCRLATPLLRHSLSNADDKLLWGKENAVAAVCTMGLARHFLKEGRHTMGEK
jgi:hypothetical protein